MPFPRTSMAGMLASALMSLPVPPVQAADIADTSGSDDSARLAVSAKSAKSSEFPESFISRVSLDHQHSLRTEFWSGDRLLSDQGGLLQASLACGDPVIYMEHKELWGVEGEVDPSLPVPLGKAKVVQEGRDVTLAGTSYMTLESLKGAGASSLLVLPVEKMLS